MFCHRGRIPAAFVPRNIRHINSSFSRNGNLNTFKTDAELMDHRGRGRTNNFGINPVHGRHNDVCVFHCFENLGCGIRENRVIGQMLLEHLGTMWEMCGTQDYFHVAGFFVSSPSKLGMAAPKSWAVC